MLPDVKPSELALQTRRGNNIANETRLEANLVQRREAVKIVHDLCPNVVPRSATRVCNCYGLVFASRRTCVNYEDDSSILSILVDDEYRHINAAECRVGDVVVYRNDEGEITHVGMVAAERGIERDMLVLSQWGALGEYLHEVGDVFEAYGTPAEFWTHRRQTP